MSTPQDRGVRRHGASRSKCHLLWPPGPARPSLHRDEVHLWLASLDLGPTRMESLLSVLSEDERVRSGRFYFRRDGERFIATRGLLRKILAQYLGESPQLIRFCRNLHGKPALASESDRTGVRFSVSHSHDLALYAVTLGREVGVDVELVRFDRAVEKIASRFFSAEGKATLLSLRGPARTVAFFKFWTIKECYLKAKGVGLWRGMEEPVVTLEEGEARVRRSMTAQCDEENGWEIRTLEPEPGYTGAVAAFGSGWRMRTWRWVEQGVRRRDQERHRGRSTS